MGCYYKDWNFQIGLVDFPALVDDEVVFLCWRSDESELRYYHRLEEGFAGRRPLPRGLSGAAAGSAAAGVLDELQGGAHVGGDGRVINPPRPAPRVPDRCPFPRSRRRRRTTPAGFRRSAARRRSASDAPTAWGRARP